MYLYIKRIQTRQKSRREESLVVHVERQLDDVQRVAIEQLRQLVGSVDGCADLAHASFRLLRLQPVPQSIAAGTQ